MNNHPNEVLRYMRVNVKRWFCMILSIHLFGNPFSQNTETKLMVDSIEYMHADTLDCSAGLFWRIVAQGDKAIPFLIEKLTDTTQTKIRFHCKKSLLSVGEVSYFALNQIADFPTFLVTRIKFDVFAIDSVSGKNCWSFYNYFFENLNKSRYQADVKAWYFQQKGNYRKRRIRSSNLTSCQKEFGIRHVYIWKE